MEAPKPEPSATVKPPPPPAETEEDRERKRHAEALAIVPDKSACLPAELRNSTAPRLELAAIGSAAVVCAIDQDRTRLLGPVACWSVAVSGPNPGALSYQDAAPLPGRGLAVMLDDRCARGFCLPKDAKVPTDPVALMAWNLDNTKVAVLVGDDLHIFNAQTKAHETSFSIRGDKGVTGDPTEIDWNGDAIFVQATDGTASPVFVFKPEGVPVGPIEALGGGKDKAVLSTRNGSFLLLKPDQVAISEQGLTTLTIYETATGKRTKLVRKLPAPVCKKDELDAVWHDPTAAVSARCKDYVAKNYAHLIGADAVAGTKNLLMLLRGPRLGELAVVDAKTLAERKAIKMPWCDEAGGGSAPGGGAAAPAPASGFAAAPAADAAAPAAKKAKGKPNAPKTDDPDAGGQ
ncbi:MAG TPA: hypothetical protein VHW23_16685 [Kofleriaceae bacterium]|nr:hypothetical protein [Kofleriaceae bacterium]